MALMLCSAWSMARLSWKLQRVTKTRHWEVFRQLMLVIVLLIWFTTVMASVYFRLSGDYGLATSFPEPSATIDPVFHSRKLSWIHR